MVQAMNATIEALFLYPIKSCRGIRLEAAELAATGLAAHGIGDREWLIVD
ncbi:MAG: MOSC N-terminal beta barrel domain-containing protein, partial [Burkholderiaceae bacterium]